MLKAFWAKAGDPVAGIVPRNGTVTVLSSHEGAVRSLAFFPDASKRIVTGCADRKVRVFNYVTKENLATMIGHTSEINIVAVTPSARWIISAGDDALCKIWNTRTYKLCREFTPHDSMVYSLVVSDDEKHVVTCSWSGEIKLFSFPKCDLEGVLRGHSTVVMSVDVDAKFRRAVSASWDYTMRVWDLETMSCIMKFEHGCDCNAAVISRDGTRAVSGDDNGSCFLWDLETGAQLQKYEGHTNMVVSLAFRTKGPRFLFATGSWDGSCRLFDSYSDTNLQGQTAVSHSKKIACVRMSRDGLLATGSFDGSVKIVDVFHNDRMRLIALMRYKRLPTDIAKIVREMLYW